MTTVTTETIEAKSDRLLTDHRVFVKGCSPGTVTAVVRGDTSVHDVDLHAGRWSCSCAARRDCSHLLAVWAVTVPSVDD